MCNRKVTISCADLHVFVGAGGAEFTQFFVNPVPSPCPLCDVGVNLLHRTIRATYSSFDAHQVSAVMSSASISSHR